MNAEDSSPLFTVRVRPFVASTVFGIGVVLLLIAVDGLFSSFLLPDEPHIALKIILWIVFVISLLMTVVGVKQLIRPARIFEVTNEGIVQYMRAGVALEKGQLIPWDRMESMELTETSGYHGRRSRIIVVAVTVRLDDDWPKERLYNFDEASGRVFLDAFSGTPAGKPLLDRLVKSRASVESAGSAVSAD